LYAGCNSISNKGGSIVNNLKQGLSIDIDGNILQSIYKYKNIVFYSNNSDGGRLYRADTNGSNVKRITNSKASIVEITDNWIYFNNWSKQGQLYKVSIDGRGYKKVCDDVNMNIFNISEGWVYYSALDKGENVYRVKINGSEKQKINDDDIYFAVKNSGYILYANNSDKRRLYRVNIDGTNRVKLTNDSIGIIKVYSDWIYYINKSDGNSIWRIKVDNSNNEKVTNLVNDFVGDSFDIEENWIFYVNGDQSQINRIDIRNFENSVLTDVGQIRNIQVLGDWVYFLKKKEHSEIFRVKIDGTSTQPEKVN
jgi:hypothetical protein